MGRKVYCPSVHDPTVLRHKFGREIRELIKISFSRGRKTLAVVRKKGSSLKRTDRCHRPTPLAVEAASSVADGRRDDERDLEFESDGGQKSTKSGTVVCATYVLILLRFGRLERPVDPLLHVEAVLGERGDVLKRPF